MNTGAKYAIKWLAIFFLNGNKHGDSDNESSQWVNEDNEK